MKKVFRVLILVCLTISLTGCVKVNVNMDIKKDKSMDFAMIMALDSSYFDDSQMSDMSVSKEDLEEYKKNGFSVEDYTEGSMKGYRIYKHIKNIDEVSSTEDVVFDLEKQSSDSPMFKVEKGLFKNKYIAVISELDTSDLESSFEDDMNFNDNSGDYGSNNDYDTNYGGYNGGNTNYFDDNFNQDNLDSLDWDNSKDNSYVSDFLRNSNSYGSGNGNMDGFSQMTDLMMKSMDISFVVNLPYKSKSNNATSVNNDGKELKWNLADESLENISFEFELYNMINIYLTIAIVVVFLLLIVMIILKQKKKGSPVVATDALTSANQNMDNGFGVMPSMGQDVNVTLGAIPPVSQDISTMPGAVPPMNQDVSVMSEAIPSISQDISAMPGVSLMNQTISDPLVNQEVTSIPIQNVMPEVAPIMNPSVDKKIDDVSIENQSNDQSDNGMQG